MAIKLRKRKNKDGTITQYLDIYHEGIRSFEFLTHLKLFAKPYNQDQRDKNKANIELASQIANKRGLELQASGYNVEVIHKQNVDFNTYFDDFIKRYKKKDLRLIKATFKHFKLFQSKEKIIALSAKSLTNSVVENFKVYLEDELNGESPSNYFKKFKMVVLSAVRKGIILKNPCQDVTIKIKPNIAKDILTFNEISLLAKTHVQNPQVKRAFLFSCYTGLRFSDIKVLKWKNIDLVNNTLHFSQAKTGASVDQNLHESALKLLGKSGKANEVIFDLPSSTACNKTLKRWAKRSGLNKHVTWHVARHSLATNIISHGSDLITASSILGHNSTRYTERYARVVDKLKNQAINKLPSIELPNN